MPPRGPSAYFLFAQEQREAVKSELEAAGEKAGVAQVGKAIGARWQQLSEEDKAAYKQRAQELKGAPAGLARRWYARPLLDLSSPPRHPPRLRAEQQAASQAAEAEAGAADAGGSPGGQGVEEAAEAHEAPAGGGGGGGAPPPPFGLPTSLVKRIVGMDPEVQRISADGVRCVAKAAELFIGLLAEKAFRHAAGLKRKNLRFQVGVGAGREGWREGRHRRGGAGRVRG